MFITLSQAFFLVAFKPNFFLKLSRQIYRSCHWLGLLYTSHRKHLSLGWNPQGFNSFPLYFPLPSLLVKGLKWSYRWIMLPPWHEWVVYWWGVLHIWHRKNLSLGWNSQGLNSFPPYFTLFVSESLTRSFLSVDVFDLKELVSLIICQWLSYDHGWGKVLDLMTPQLLLNLTLQVVCEVEE